jgi:hypothetical protein
LAGHLAVYNDRGSEQKKDFASSLRLKQQATLYRMKTTADIALNLRSIPTSNVYFEASFAYFLPVRPSVRLKPIVI